MITNIHALEAILALHLGRPWNLEIPNFDLKNRIT